MEAFDMEALSLTAKGLPYLMIGQPASRKVTVHVALHQRPGQPARTPREPYFGPESGGMTLAEINDLAGRCDHRK
jgi:hypothetical protein